MHPIPHPNHTSRSLRHLLCSTTIARAQDTAPIDRHALVTRHNIEVHAIDPNGAMAVGNGSFAFNFDVTGLQSFPEYYAKTMPIGILSDWGWHSFPNPNHYTLDTFKMTTIPKYDRQFVFPSASTSNPPPDAAYLRENPNRFGLGRIGLEMTHADGSKVLITDLANIDERLDIWAGILTSTFTVDGQPVHVTTIAAPNRDEVATCIESPLIASGHLKIRIAFPYASNSFGPDYQDWDHPELHTTTLVRRGATEATFDRTLDATRYTLYARWSLGASLAKTAPHQYPLSHSRARSSIELTVRRSGPIIDPPSAASQSSRHLRRCRNRLPRLMAALLDHRRSHRSLRQLGPARRRTRTPHRPLAIRDGRPRQRRLPASGNGSRRQLLVRQIPHGDVLVALRALGALGTL